MNGKELITSMIGKTYQFKGEIVEISSFNKIEDEYIISLSNNEIITSFARNLKSTLNEKLKPVSLPENQASATPAISENLSDSLVSLKDILMDNISKVQNDKTYVGQAKVVSSSVKEIINLAKVDIEYRKLAKGIA